MRPNNLLAWFYMILMGQMFAVVLRAFMILIVATIIAIGFMSSCSRVPNCDPGFVYSRGLCVVGYEPSSKKN
jgi:hypothetical protein